MLRVMGRSRSSQLPWSFLTTFEVSNIFFGSCNSSENWLEPKIKTHNQVKLVEITDLICINLRAYIR